MMYRSILCVLIRVIGISRSLNVFAVLLILGTGEKIVSDEPNTLRELKPYQLTKRTLHREGDSLERRTTTSHWDPNRTAVIVCDVWDYHHCINAVRRIEEMLPRMDDVLKEARQRGSIIIHAPSDCMETYRNHPARLRAIDISKRPMPPKIASWNSKIPSEASATYPIDQSDGGEDDDPEEHAAWSAKLTDLGRNPAMPWKAQSPALTINPDKDFISDRGMEVWGILKDKEIQHVLMIGVHTNMCVLGRPFGLRQLRQNGMEVVLVRDLTDCMYNPKRWPYVNHFTGNDLIISYVEQFLCPTITSDQIVGGNPVQFKRDTRTKKDLLPTEVSARITAIPEWKRIEWAADSSSKPSPQSASGNTLIRCSLSISNASLGSPVTLVTDNAIEAAWLNGHALEKSAATNGTTTALQNQFLIRKEQTFGNDDANVLVLKCRIDDEQSDKETIVSVPAPTLITEQGKTALAGGWQMHNGEGEGATNIPLPAKFGLPPEVYFYAN